MLINYAASPFKPEPRYSISLLLSVRTIDNAVVTPRTIACFTTYKKL